MNQFNNRIVRFVFFFLISVLLCLTVTTIYVQYKTKNQKDEMQQLVVIKSNKISDVISNYFTKGQFVSTLIMNNNGEISDIDHIASVLTDDPVIKSIALAPNGVVQYVYPAEDGASQLNIDYFSKETPYSEAIQALKTKSIALKGPVSGLGGKELIGILPVYLDEKKEQFWGFISITLNYPNVLKGADLDQLFMQGYTYEIMRANPNNNNRTVIETPDYLIDNPKYYAECPIKVVNMQWVLRIVPIHEWYESPEAWILFFTVFLVSLLFGILMVDNHDAIRMKKELEYLSCTDPLTCVLNRRGGLKEFEDAVYELRNYVILCYMDLNKFKQTNDSFGHNVGDEVLRRYSQTLRTLIDSEKYIFARMGGDEFILLFKNTKDLFEAKKLIETVRDRLNNDKIDINGHQVAITFSAGFAVYPEDGRTLDALISAADRRMYNEKKKEVDEESEL